ncbi:MAG TPA: ABC transporter ATP-binding protein [Gaiellaceae bacterium]|nr:ABC transporter ATP-binding protein [Gaiellaceae bacterium]
MTAAIRIEHLHVRRGDREVIRDLSLEVAPGRVTGLLGPSGCGKTTLMRAIVGVQVVAGGRVRVLGREAGDASLRREIGYVTQAAAVYLDLTVAENLRYFAAITGAPAGRVGEVIAQVALADAAEQVVGSLSGGQQSRVSLATALVHRPKVLVLDEPTVGLDPILRADLWESFRKLAAEGTTLLISSHSMDEAAECDELLLMREGAILAATTPDELRARTGENDLGRAFLAVVRRSEK